MVVALKRGECAERGLLSGHILRWVVGLAGFIRDEFNPVGLVVELFVGFQTGLSDFGAVVDVKTSAFVSFVVHADIQPLVLVFGVCRYRYISNFFICTDVYY